MPADVTYLCGVSPPFAGGSSLLSIHTSTQSYYPTSYSGFNHSQTFNRVPCCSFKDLKSCLKVFQQTDMFCDVNTTDKSLHQRLHEEKSMTCVSTKATNAISRKEKRVTFADAQGGALTLIKYLTESTNEPPKSLTSGDLIRDLMKNLDITSSEESKNCSGKKRLLLKFDQPVADYVNFKRKIDLNNISLENVVLKDNCSIQGTVKVKNIAYNKIVTIHLTFDDWATSKDIQCNYVKNAYETGLLDTFQFNIDIPDAFFDGISPQIQFCVCYSCKNEQFWDNNCGNNYLIVTSKSSGTASCSKPISVPQRSNCHSFPSTYGELPSPQHNSWFHMEDAVPFY